MTGKITQGASFGGIVDYAMEKENSEVIDYDNVRTERLLATKDFELQASMNERVKKPVMHIALNFHADDKGKLDNAKMRAIAREVITKMGFVDTQYIVVRHHDAAHPHMHIIANRVNNNGASVSDKYCRLKFNEIRKEIESKYPDLTAANGKNLEKINPLKLKGKDAVRYKIHKAINIEIHKSSNIDELREKLKTNHGIGSELKFRSGDISHVDGIKFQLDNTWITGSKVDKSCSYLNLIKKIEQNKEQANQKPLSNTKNNETTNTINPIIAALLSGDSGQSSGVKQKKKSWAKEDDRGM